MHNYKSLFDLTGKTALVIGAGSGIGQASAQGLAAFGARVFCGDVNAQNNAETVRTIVEAGGQASALAVDLNDPASLTAAFAETGAVDALVCTPGINVRKPLLEISDDEFDRVVNLNLKGTFRAMKTYGKAMAERGSGSIITFASIRAQVVEPGQGVYAATKAGILQMCRALAAELGPRGVRVNAIGPGVVETPLTAQIKNRPDWYAAYANKNALGRWGQPHELVGAVLLLASEAGSYITGNLMMVDGGWTAIDGRFTPPL
ncbi:MAG: SDR family oxidoreductase [Anaerolineales bacterium]|nr:SDR family oxidoreductase [Anaerolineales bacterium]